MQRLFKEFGITKIPLQSNSKTALQFFLSKAMFSSSKWLYFTFRPLSSLSRILAIRSSVMKAVNFADTTSPTSFFLFQITRATNLFSSFAWKNSLTNATVLTEHDKQTRISNNRTEEKNNDNQKTLLLETVKFS